VCGAVEASGEYDASEPAVSRERSLEQAFALFTRAFGRSPASLCPPDYRWSAGFEAQAVRLGATVLQGAAERAGRWPRVRRLIHRWRWPQARGGLLCMPPRIALPKAAEIEAWLVGAAPAWGAAAVSKRRSMRILVIVFIGTDSIDSSLPLPLFLIH